MARIDEILAAERPGFARAVKAVIAGDAPALRAELSAEPELVWVRSSSAHRATLLHYTAANGIECELQREVPNADEIARMLLVAGAEPDALCDAYDGKCLTTLDLLASSDHPNEAGVAGRLTVVLCSHGAAVDGVEGNGSPLATALYFANLDCVDALLTVGARTENVVFAAAAGKTDWVDAWLEGDRDDAARPVPASFPLASNRRIAAQQALVFASMCGRIEVVRALVGRGVDVNACPPGSHRTGAALHTAAYQGQVEIAAFLLKSDADPAIRDARHRARRSNGLNMRRADDEVELKKWHGFWLEEPVRRDCVALHSLIAGGAGRWFIDAFASYCTSGLVALCRSTPVTFA